MVLRRIPVQKSLSIFFAILVVTSTFVGGIALVGTQPVTENQSGTAEAVAGDKLWNTTTQDGVWGSPTIANGTVYIGSEDGGMYAMDKDTGNIKWNASTGGPIDSSPTVANGTVYVGSDDNNLYAFDADTGSQEWSFTTGDLISGSPTVKNGTVFVGSYDSYLYAVDADTGTQEWRSSVGGTIHWASATVKNGTVYIGSDGQALEAYDTDTGNQKWTFSTTGNIRSGATVKNGTVYFGSGDNYVYALDTATGNQEWSYQTGGGILSSTPTIKNGTLYIGSRDNSVYALDANTGTKEWSSATSGRVQSSPTIANGVVYIGSDDGNLYAFDADTGSQKWSYATGGSVRSKPTVANGVVYTGSMGGDVYAFDTSHSKSSSGTTEELHTLGHVGPVEGITSLSGLSASSTDSTSTYLEWNANQVDTTHVEYKTTDNSTWNTYSTLSGSDTTETLTGLLNGETYDIRVVADSDSTVQSSSTFTTTLPDDDQPNLTAPSEGKITVDRESVTTNNGDVKVQYRENGTSNWTTETVAPHDFTTFDITNLSDGTEYEVRVRTQTDHVTGSWTSPVSAKTIIPTKSLSGVVVNQNDQRVENATVVVTGVNKSSLDANPSEIESRAQEILDDASDPTPPEWDRDLNLVGSSGKFKEASTNYVAAHPLGDWGLTQYEDPAELGNPRVQLPANEQFALSVWDPSKTSLYQDGVNRDLPGGVVDNNKIVIESIDHSGGVVDTQKVSTDTTYDVGLVGGQHDLAKVSLPEGFYRVYPEGSPETAYVIVVGDPDDIAATIRADLKNDANELTAEAKDIREYMNNDVLTQYRTTTGPNGTWSKEVSAQITRVQVHAYKVPPGVDDPRNTSLQDVRTYYKTTDYNGSYIIPASSNSHSVPDSDVRVEVVEAQAPQYPDLDQFKNRTEAFEALLQNLSYSDLPSAFQERLEGNVSQDTEEEMAQMAERLQKLVNENSQLESKVEEIRDQEFQEVNVSETNNTELKERIQSQEQAIRELRSSLDAETTTSTSNGNVSSSAIFTTDLTREQVTVIAKFSNGTTSVVDDEYIEVNQDSTAVLDGGTEVSVNDYPLPENGPSSVKFEYKVANGEGIGKASAVANNPAMGGDVPKLDAISLSTLYPGPSEEVQMSLSGGDETQIVNITSTTVYSPSGEVINAQTTDSDSISFTTSGEGQHYIEVTFETASGGQGTLTHRVKAGDRDNTMPPGVRLKETPFGTVTVVGDGFVDGSVDVSNGGNEIDITTQIPENGDIPTKVHLYKHSLLTSSETTTTFKIVEGESQKSINKNVQVVVHEPIVTNEEATLYRFDNALPREGEAGGGDVTTSSDETTIETYTNDDGVLELSTNNNPGIIERSSWYVDLTLQELPSPSLPFTILEVGELNFQPMAGVKIT